MALYHPPVTGVDLLVPCSPSSPGSFGHLRGSPGLLPSDPGLLGAGLCSGLAVAHRGVSEKSECFINVGNVLLCSVSFFFF